LRVNLVQEARARGIEPIELRTGDDLVQVVQAAVARGADGLAAAGGDGTQALVARIAAEHDLPFACIPAGTRNHFALDLGVDRSDVVGALDAFVDGGERRVDLAEVNGRTFVNNVSLGLYGEAVQQTRYRNAKLRTILDIARTDIGAGHDAAPELRWTDARGTDHVGATVILVSNNPYRLGRLIGSGTRPRVDAGLLGIAAMTISSNSAQVGKEDQPTWCQWCAPRFDVDAPEDVSGGIDGEAARLTAPLQFRTVPGSLRVRLARHHTGTSPSNGTPERLADGIRMLTAIARGR